MSTRKTRRKGNTLALVVVVIGVVALLVAFFALNYGSLLGTQKEAQTAIDAAALEATRQMATVTVNTPLGPMGLIDVAAEANTGQFSGAAAGVPIIGVNTSLATSRLDFIIGQKLGNSTIQALAERDINSCAVAIRNLTSAISARHAQILQAAQNAYEANSRRLGQTNRHASNFLVTFGRLTDDNGTTNVPIPVPNNADSESGASVPGDKGLLYYKPYHVYSLTNPNKVVFAAIADEPRLVDRAQFVGAALSVGGVPVPPSVALVECDESVQAVASGDMKGTKQAGILHASACAQTGGTRPSNSSGVYCLSFRGGFPPNQSNLDFRSAAGIMNSSNGWTDNSGTRTWFKGAHGSGTPPGRVIADNSANFNGSNYTTPNDALAMGIYDWLRQMGLRPNVAQVVGALSYNLQSMVAPQNGGTTQAAPDGPIGFNLLEPTRYLIQSAYAQNTTGNTIPQTTGWLGLTPDTVDGRAADPRNVEVTLLSDPSGQNANTGYLNAFAYAPASVFIPAQAASIFIDESGQPNAIGADGQPVSLTAIAAAQDAIVWSHTTSEINFRAGTLAMQQLDSKIAGLRQDIINLQGQASGYQSQIATLSGQANTLRAQANANPPPANASQLIAQADDITNNQIPALQAQIDNINNVQIPAKQQQINDATAARTRAQAVKTNGAAGMDTTAQMISQFRTLTALSCDDLGNGKFKIGLADFYTHNTYNTSPTSQAQVTSTADVVADGDAGNSDRRVVGLVEALKAAGSGGTANFSCRTLLNDAWDASGTSGNIVQIYTKFSNTLLSPHSCRPRTPSRGGDWLMPAAYAKNSMQFPPGFKVPGFNPPNLNLMFLFVVHGDSSKNSGGGMFITSLPTSPFVRQNTAPGQYYYQNMRALTTSGPQVQGRPQANIVWGFIGRDNCGNPSQPVKPQDLQGLANIFQPTDSDRHNLNWCIAGTADSIGRIFNVGLQSQGDNVLVCPILDGEFVVTCPIPGGCNLGTTIDNSTGTVNVNPCPPVPPVMG